MSEQDAVLYAREGHVGVITLNRPDNRNSMTPELLDAFHGCTRQAAADAEARCVVVTGKGRCFSAGADFKSNIQRQHAGRPLMPHEASYAMYIPFLSLLDIEVPVIEVIPKIPPGLFGYRVSSLVEFHGLRGFVGLQQ